MRKHLKDYKTDIQKCSKCGLCMSVCPVFKVTKNDCTLSRGLFIMLKGIVDGDLKLNKKVDKYLDKCLKCNACKDFCPTNIDSKKIFSCAKEQYFYENKKKFPIIVLFQNFLKTIGILTSFYRFFRIDKFMKIFYKVLLKTKLGRNLILLNSVLENGFNKKNKKLERKKIKIVYFKGCVNEYLNPRVKNSVEFLLNKIGVEVIPIKFKCCGSPFLSEGDVENFMELAKYNIEQIPENFDYFLTDCATCRSSFKEYERYLEDENLLEKIRKINKKSISTEEFVVDNIQNFEFKENVSFTFHKPCHMENTDFIKKFLKKCRNAKYVQMKDYDTCCGFAGTFALKNNYISKEISKEKGVNALNSTANYILSSCPACIMGLNQGLLENFNIEKTSKNFLEFIAENIM